MYKRIIWVLYLASKAHTHSDGSSPVTTTHLLLHHFLVTQKVYFHAGILVRENRYAILLIINQTLYKYGR
jgi:hypothetical protein